MLSETDWTTVKDHLPGGFLNQTFEDFTDFRTKLTDKIRDVLIDLYNDGDDSTTSKYETLLRIQGHIRNFNSMMDVILNADFVDKYVSGEELERLKSSLQDK